MLTAYLILFRSIFEILGLCWEGEIVLMTAVVMVTILNAYIKLSYKRHFLLKQTMRVFRIQIIFSVNDGYFVKYL